MRSRIITAAIVVAAIIGLRPALAAAAPGSASEMLSATAAERAAAVSPPVIDAPALVTASLNEFVSIQATATDPDLGDILTITASGAPAGLALSHAPSVSPAVATLSGTPPTGEEGVYPILWTVTDGSQSASTTTELTLVSNQAPAVSAPAAVLSAELFETAFAVTAFDPDGESILSLEADLLPAGATFVVNALKTSGEFAWTPALGQQGSYPITFTAASGAPAQSGSASTVITVGPKDNPVVISNPGNKTVSTGVLLTFNVTATDPDGDAITTFVAQGTQNTALPAGAIFTTTGVGTPAAAGVFSWTPGPLQNAVYNIDFIARSGPFNTRTVLIVRITVNPTRPVVTAPAAVSGVEAVPITFDVTASDADGQAIATLTAAGLPPGATFASAPGSASGVFHWTPNYTQSGVYPVVFTASNTQSGSATTRITVVDAPNSRPTAVAGGPYSGVEGVPVEFDGSASSDPDGNALAYSWSFGDGTTGSGATVSHTYAIGGLLNVVLTVTDAGDPPLSDSEATVANITSIFDASLFTTGGNKAIRLGSGKPEWCVYLERADGGPLDLEFASFRLAYGGGEITAVVDKSTLAGDANKNGLSDLALCFSKTDLRTLFASLPGGRTTVAVEVRGRLNSGAFLSGSIEVDVVSSGGSPAGAVSPNPLNPDAVLTFTTEKAGTLRVTLYDAQGRFVRTLADRSSAAAGYHDVRIDGRDARGTRLATGVYFYRVESPDGVFGGRFTILK
ncbi:MAG TPA: putative Ig domain-containing protein [Acidobacteriota bacterium]|nr:putative Ig domain-containing protein [Acidobacteriota bacterium]